MLHTLFRIFKKSDEVMQQRKIIKNDLISILSAASYLNWKGSEINDPYDFLHMTDSFYQKFEIASYA